MAARMRLARVGAKKRPFFRVIVTDGRAKRDGRCIETLGTYDPRQTPPAVKLKADRVKHWLAYGVQPSATVARLIRQHGLDVTPAEA